MKKYTRSLAAALVASGMVAISATSASARLDVIVEEIAATVDTATDDSMKTDDLTAALAADGSFSATSTSSTSTVTMPKTAGGMVVASKSDDTATYSVGVGLGTGTTEAGALASDGSVVYNTSSPTDVTVQPTDEGFRIHTVVNESTAPTEYVHALTLPAGASLAFGRDLPLSPEEGAAENAATDDAVFVVGADGKLMAGFGTAWAKDSAGTDVPTHFEIRGSSLVQVVDHRTAAYAYPIVADPYLWIDLIKYATWEYHSGYGWTLKVTPTWWARSNAGSYLVGTYGWTELYDKYRYRGLNTNLGGMRDQYICHQQVVAVYSPTKSTWNLDEWRPDVSYLSTVNARCNPGGSVIFD